MMFTVLAIRERERERQRLRDENGVPILEGVNCRVMLFISRLDLETKKQSSLSGLNGG